MNSKFDEAYYHYKKAAKMALSIYKSSPKDKRNTFINQYPNVILVNKELKLKDMFNCIAIDHGYQNWVGLKSHINNVLLTIKIKHNIWLEFKNTLTKKRHNYSEVRNIRDLYEKCMPTRVNLNNVTTLKNLNFNIESHMLSTDSPFGGDFAWLNISNSDLSNNSWLGISFCVCKFENVKFSGSFFSDLPSIIINGTIHADMERIRPDFEHATIINCDLSDSVMCNVYARNAIFTGCNFSNTLLMHSNFFDADLRYCNFTNANLINSTISSNIIGANFCGTNMRGTYPVSLRDAIINFKTIFPDGTMMHPDKNNIKIMRKGVSMEQSDLIHWLCPKGHEWQQTLKEFSTKTVCGICKTNLYNWRNINLKIKSKEPNYMISSKVSSLLRPIEKILIYP